jgi:enterochelin esterase family protein
MLIVRVIRGEVKTFYNVLPTGRLIDHLVEEAAIEPPIVITVDLAEGADARRYAGEAAFLADTLVPWARCRWPISTAPEDVIATGTSRRGLAATIAVFERPDAIGMALPLSGSFYWRPEGDEEFEWLTRRFAREPKRDIELYVTAGTLETVVTPTNRGHYQLATARHLRDVLEAKGYDYVYEEFVGVHDEMNWQSALADALRALLPPR